MKINFTMPRLALILAVAFFQIAALRAADGISISHKSLPEAFPIADAAIAVDEVDHIVVTKVAAMLAGDIEAVTGSRPAITGAISGKNVIVIGTVGRSKLIDALVKEERLDVSAISGGWERFIVKTIPSPYIGTEKLLVIAGSDRRGTAYGAMTLSENIGVEPWVWWADVPARKSENLWLSADMVSKTPTIKYRGLFINDEDWGLKPWAAKTYGSELGDIGPRTYARVCELLLRLKANMLAPAMHSCTGAFYSHPASKLVADTFGIIITTSHCEPLLFNNAAKSEWDSKRDGEWNYRTNRDVIYNKFDSRVAEAAPFENIYTVAMRGVHDEGMRGNMSVADRIEILGDVMRDQRAILEKHLGRSADEVPQIFVPYKETLDLYQAGLEVPDDVTIVWPDDNYGYMKRLSTPQERKRAGEAGVYYHTSYLGTPHDYLWLCTTPPALMYEELKKAYDMGATRYWLLNVGDIKPAELDIQTFCEMAWDFGSFDFKNINGHQAAYLAKIFGEKYRADFQNILDDYYRLAWSRKPEYMGWELEWDRKDLEELHPTDFSFTDYNDAQQRIADYSRISDRCDAILAELPANLRPAFFEMLAYPVMAAWQMNRKFLMAQLNGEMAAKSDREAANWAAARSKAAFDSIAALNGAYNSLLGGKWKGMMAIPPGYCAKYHLMPELTIFDGAGSRAVDLSVDAGKYLMEKSHVVNLRETALRPLPEGVALLDGFGYDSVVLRLGDPASEDAETDNLSVDYMLPAIDADSVTVYVYTLPIFPVHEGRGVRFGVSLDSAPQVVSEYIPEEWSFPWKMNVLRNSTIAKITFPVSKGASFHRLNLRALDPGIMVQRIVLDWGGLKDSYVGPSFLTARYR